jgi:hypothetical protein
MAGARPKYGALQVMNHADGPSPRFGSCYFLQRPQVLLRSTFTYGGSQEPDSHERTGTAGELDPVLAPLLEALERGEGAFGVADLTAASLFDQLIHGLAKPFRDPKSRPLGRALDHFIEVQIHGKISLREDVERLVADPAFRNHLVGEVLDRLSAEYEIPLHWHPGLTMSVESVPEVFRDYPVRALAERIAGRGRLDAANIGAAANSLELHPELWQTWANRDDALTQFRRLWHVLVLYGAPADPDTRPVKEP